MKGLISISTVFLISICCNSGKLKDKKDISSQAIDTLPIQDATLTTTQLNPVQQTRKLTGKIIVIDVSYSAIECECAQWVETKYLNKKSKNKPPEATRFYLETSNSLGNADALWDGEHLPLQLKLTGQFYIMKGLPLNYKPGKSSPDSASVFRYEKIKIISPYYRKALDKIQ